MCALQAKICSYLIFQLKFVFLQPMVPLVREVENSPLTHSPLPLEIRILPKNNESAFCRLLKTDLYRRGWAGGAFE